MPKVKDKEIVESSNTEISTNVNTGIQIDIEDIEIPRINVCQKMSNSDAPVGSVLFDKTYDIAPPNKALKVIPVVAQKGYREDIPFEEQEVPRIAWTKEAADDIQSDSEWKMTEFAELTLLVQQPEEGVNDDAFQLPIGNHNYCLGKINVGKNAYRSTYKRLATNAAFTGQPIHQKIWNFTSEELSKGKYTWFNPTLTATKETVDEDVLAFVENFLNS